MCASVCEYMTACASASIYRNVLVGNSISWFVSFLFCYASITELSPTILFTQSDPDTPFKTLVFFSSHTNKSFTFQQLLLYIDYDKTFYLPNFQQGLPGRMFILFKLNSLRLSLCVVWSFSCTFNKFYFHCGILI